MTGRRGKQYRGHKQGGRWGRTRHGRLPVLVFFFTGAGSLLCLSPKIPAGRITNHGAERRGSREHLDAQEGILPRHKLLSMTCWSRDRGPTFRPRGPEH